jgi:glycogenin glucosyltransferase
MASPYAVVSLLTSDSYLPGVLTLAAALKDIHPSPAVHPEVDFQTVCLVTPETVDIASIKLLRKAFDVVVGVEIIEENNERGLQLLGEHFAHVAQFLPPFPLSVRFLGTSYSKI